jgi:cysteine desulfurase/selenocysteine lyase
VVIDAISKYYQEINANIHRGVHTLSQLATDAYEISAVNSKPYQCKICSWYFYFRATTE